MYYRSTKVFCFICLVFLVGSSCGNKWKKTTETSIFFKLNTGSTTLNKTSTGHLSFDQGTVLIHRIDFEGDRKQGDNVSISRRFDGGIAVNLETGLADSTINFDIPQGTYTHVELEVRLKEKEDKTEPSIRISGIYDNTTPVLFEYWAGIEFESEGEAEDGSGEIVLVEGEPATALVKLDPVYWFEPVTENMLDKADLKEVDGDSTIYISPDFNEKIYDLMADRVDEASETVFK